MEGTTRIPGRDRRRLALLVTTVAGLVAAGAFLNPARALTTTTLGVQASPSGYPVGAAIFDSATLGSGVNPTGSITFRAYGPSDPTCTAAPVHTSVTPVQGNGYYTSKSFVANVAGTYRWTATYSGDAANSAAGPNSCSAPEAAVIVGKKVPTLRSWATRPVATGPVWETAALYGGGPAGPTGTLTFSAYGPNNLVCAGPPIFTSTRSVTGNGQYLADAFTPTLTGTYQWVVVYGGDGNNNGASTMCSDTASAVTVVATSSVTLSASPASVPAGAATTVTWGALSGSTAGDWVGLYAAGAPDYATRAWAYTSGAASGSVSLIVPLGTAAGGYEVRLFTDNSLIRMATAPLTVTAP